MVNQKTRLSSLLIIFSSFLLLTFFVGCSDDNPVNPATNYSKLGMIRSTTATYIGLGTSAFIKAADVYANLNDGNTANDPFILSIRGTTDYANGHVPGAVNIGYRDIAKAASLALLPTDQQIVVVCYTGHTASQTAMLLNMLGYDAVAMKYGMMSWTIDPTVTPSYYIAANDCGNYPTSTATVTPGTHALSDLGTTTSTDTTEIIRVAVDAYLSSGVSPVISASDVYINLNDGNTANDPLLLSVRGSHYALGHVEGAINIAYGDIATEASLAKLPTDKQIVVICYTGHSASLVTLFLNSLGYDAVCMKYGMASWTIEPTINPYYYNADNDCGDYPFEN